MSELEFLPFEPDNLADWLERSRAEYIAERVAAGDTQEQAEANASASLDRTFPGGKPGPGQMVGLVVADGVPVGELWIGPSGPDPLHWWVWNVVIDEALRGRGLGRRAMQLAERLAAEQGAQTLGLNVFAHNDVARHLYDSLGYEETALQMRKSLTTAD